MVDESVWAVLMQGSQVVELDTFAHVVNALAGSRF